MKLANGRHTTQHLLNKASDGTVNSKEASERARANWYRVLKSRAFRDFIQMMRDRERNLVNAVTGSFAFDKVENPLTIAFDHLDLNLKSNGAPVLRDIFGCFRPFNITALMGSSGAGKVCVFGICVFCLFWCLPKRAHVWLRLSC